MKKEPLQQFRINYYLENDKKLMEVYYLLKNAFLRSIKDPEFSIGFVFDMDQTIVKSYPAFAKVWHDVYKEETDKSHFLEGSPTRTIRIIEKYGREGRYGEPFFKPSNAEGEDKFKSDIVSRRNKARDKLFTEYQESPMINNFDKVLEIFRQLKEHGIISYLAIGSASSQTNLDNLAEKLELNDKFDAIKGKKDNTPDNDHDKKHKNFARHIFEKRGSLTSVIFGIGDDRKEDNEMVENFGTHAVENGGEVEKHYISFSEYDKTKSTKQEDRHPNIPNWQKGELVFLLAAIDAIEIAIPEIGDNKERVNALTTLKDKFTEDFKNAKDVMQSTSTKSASV